MPHKIVLLTNSNRKALITLHQELNSVSPETKEIELTLTGGPSSPGFVIEVLLNKEILNHPNTKNKITCISLVGITANLLSNLVTCLSSYPNVKLLKIGQIEDDLNSDLVRAACQDLKRQNSHINKEFAVEFTITRQTGFETRFKTILEQTNPTLIKNLEAKQEIKAETKLPQMPEQTRPETGIKRKAEDLGKEHLPKTDAESTPAKIGRTTWERQVGRLVKNSEEERQLPSLRP